MKKNKSIFSLFFITAVFYLLCGSAVAGDLDPSNPPGSTMKPLSQVQPRTPVQNLAGDAEATYVISQPGSYYLTANIVGEENKDGISVEANNVAIDLNGFSMIGVTNSGNGIVFDPDKIGGRVINGMICDWGQNGINAETLTSGFFDRLACENNGSRGITLGNDSMALNCLVRGNNSFGIEASDNCMIRECVARNNHAAGFKLYSGGQINACIAEGNSFEGIYAAYESTVVNCNVSFNRWGVVLRKGCLARNNNIVNNSEIGIRCGGTGGSNRVESNNVTSNFTGIEIEASNTNNLIIRNSVRDTATPFNISAGNSFGPIVNVVGAGDISGVANSSHPLANFQF
jgi:hypothetical protein